MSKFHERLRDERKRKGMKQAQMAAALGISSQNYSVYEKTREPKYDLLVQMATFFGVSTDYLLGETDWRNQQFQETGTGLGLHQTSCAELAEAKKEVQETVDAIVEHSMGTVKESDVDTDKMRNATLDLINFILTTKEGAALRQSTGEYIGKSLDSTFAEWMKPAEPLVGDDPEKRREFYNAVVKMARDKAINDYAALIEAMKEQIMQSAR